MSTDFYKYTVNDNFSEPTGLAFLDLDSDKLSDLVAVSSGFDEDDLLWHKSTSSSFNATTSNQLVYGNLGGGRNAFYGADMDKDGDIDLVSAESGSDNVVVWYNNDGKGTSWTIL
ncbi:MAG: hypothetical protein ACKO5Q_29180 [Microcystaceae cyanobacterium]